MTSRRLAFVLFCLITSAGAADDPTNVVKKGQPKDVALFIDRYVECNHWGGEEPYDAERRKEILAAVTRLRCLQLDADEKVLLKEYMGNPAVSRAIKKTKRQYE